MLKNVPVMLEGYKLRVTEEPALKTYTTDGGAQEIAVDPTTKTNLFVVSLLMKQRATESRSAGKGFEVKVTLEADPGEVDEGQLVELIQPRISQWSMNGREGVAVRAAGLSPVS